MRAAGVSIEAPMPNLTLLRCCCMQVLTMTALQVLRLHCPFQMLCPTPRHRVWAPSGLALQAVGYLPGITWR